ncbi:MAG: DUF1259 domain-containing protein [Flavisolibacter sp.]
MKPEKTFLKIFFSILLSFIFLSRDSLAQQKTSVAQKDKNKQDMAGNKMPVASSSKSLDTATIQRITGIKGMSNKGEYKLSIAQNDLHVEVDGFKIIPPMGLGSWIDFAPSGSGAMIMGDLVLTEADLPVVQKEIIRQGLTISAIHNHFLRNHPVVMYMHIGGIGPTEQMALKLKTVLHTISESRGITPSSAPPDSVANSLDTKRLDNILGYKGEMSKGVYKYTIGRPDVHLIEHGVTVTTFMGFNTWAAWQGTPDHAAVAGDFTMLENEVAPVIKTLIENGIEVVAVHNHMVHEQPRIFFLHYWGVGKAEELAKGLKAALNQTGKGNHHNEMNMDKH